MTTPAGIQRCQAGGGHCGRCGKTLEELGKEGSVLLLCHGCGLVVGSGPEAKQQIDAYIARGRAEAYPSVPGVHAMQLLKLGLA